MLDGVMYEQIDGVSMGASLGPVLANIIMTEMERCVVDTLIESGKIKFYSRYIDDTLLLVKPEDVDEILSSTASTTIWSLPLTNSTTVFHTFSIWKYTLMDYQSTGKKPTRLSLCTMIASLNGTTKLHGFAP